MINKPHKWAKEIIHWANGGEIESRNGKDWELCTEPFWSIHAEYRIKPTPKEPQYLYVYKCPNGWLATDEIAKSSQFKFIGKIKLEDE
jgi:hypothetical protein